MSSNELLQRIEVNPEVCNGRPIIKGTRISVQSILEYLAAGDSFEDVLSAFDRIQREDIQACLLYASRLSSAETDSIQAA